MHDIAIIGAGPAGLSAALYACRSGNTVIVFEGNIYGGQIGSTPEVENYPAVQRISGVDFAMNLYNQAQAQGAEITFEAVTDASLVGKIKEVTAGGKKYQAKAVIIANGARRRKLGCKGEEELSGRGVSYCATCDGAFFRGKEVAIVGGGDTALEDALFLANNCSKVYIIHRRDEFRGHKVLVDSVLSRENIEVVWNSMVDEIVGQQAVEAAIISDKNSGEKTRLNISGIFVAIGLEPENSIFKGQIELDPSGYIIAGESCKTNLDGVYAAGDTRTKTLRQIVTAAADGAIAAFEAANYINSVK